MTVVVTLINEIRSGYVMMPWPAHSWTRINRFALNTQLTLGKKTLHKLTFIINYIKTSLNWDIFILI